MEIKVNNISQSIPAEYTVSMLLHHLNYPKSSAVFINDRQMLFGEYDSYTFKENDNVRIIRILGGG